MKKIIAVAISLILIIGCLPMYALAAQVSDNTGTLGELGFTEEMDTNYGTVTLNKGEIQTNEGTVTENNGAVVTNEGTVITNGQGTVSTNNGTVEFNARGALIILNAEDGTVTENKGDLTENEGTVTTNNGTVETNNGTVTENKTNATVMYNESGATITTNSGDVEDNNGTIQENLAGAEVDFNFNTVERNMGSVVHNNYGGTVNENSGMIYNNNGTVTTNEGTVTENYGTVTTNEDTVKFNNGTVTTNEDTVKYNNGTVTTNEGTVEYNYDTVTTNEGIVERNNGTVGKNTGEVFNQEYGIVEGNYGIVYNGKYNTASDVVEFTSENTACVSVTIYDENGNEASHIYADVSFDASTYDLAGGSLQLDNSGATRKGYTLTYTYTDANGNEIVLKPGDTLTDIDAALILQMVWEKNKAAMRYLKKDDNGAASGTSFTFFRAADTLAAVQCGGVKLTEGVDYTVSAAAIEGQKNACVITFTESFLANHPNGAAVYICFSAATYLLTASNDASQTNG